MISSPEINQNLLIAAFLVGFHDSALCSIRHHSELKNNWQSALKYSTMLNFLLLLQFGNHSYRFYRLREISFGQLQAFA